MQKEELRDMEDTLMFTHSALEALEEGCNVMSVSRQLRQLRTSKEHTFRGRGREEVIVTGG